MIATILRPRGGSGIQTHALELQRYLAAQGRPVQLVTPFSSGGLLRDAVFGVRLLLAPLSGAAGVRWYRAYHRAFLQRALRQRLSRLGAAVVYCGCPVSALAALRARRGLHQRVVLAVHFSVSQADEWAGSRDIPRGGSTFRAIRRLERGALAQVDGVVYVSDAAREALWTRPPSHVPVATIPNFVSAPAPWSPAPPGRVADLVTVGALEPVKNHSFILHVLAAAGRRGHHYTLHVVGGGRERRALLALRRRLNLQETVSFLGHVPGAAQRLEGYRAYLHAARTESFGIAVIEAMAAGLPVVAAPLGGVRGIFDDGTHGRYWDPDDVEASASVLIELMSDERSRARMAAAARSRFLEVFDAEVVCPELCGFLTTTAARRAERPGMGAGQPEAAVG